MAKSKIVITFNSITSVGEYLSFTSNLSPIEIKETFATLRTGPYLAGIAPHVWGSAYDYYFALGLDYNSSGLYNFSIVSNVVTIEANQPNVVFNVAPDFLAPSVSYVITNSVEALPITFVSIDQVAHAANVCDYIEMIVATNVLAVSVDTGTGYYANLDNPFTVVWPRGSTGSITVMDSMLNESSVNFKTPAFLTEVNTFVNINSNPNGADAIITMYDDYALSLEYSLDNVTWQTSNTFPSLGTGSYTVYIKDQFGCNISKDFTITIFQPIVNIVDAFSYISPAMSIRYKKDEAWDFVDVYKNDDNTLSCEEFTNQAYSYIQKFKPSNLVTTQLLSNYENIEVNVIKEDGSKQSITVDTKIKFLDIKDRRDSRIYGISIGKSGIYFTSGNLYDYNTGVINGAYALNGSLPDYGVVGNYINIIGSGWFLIEDIIYNEAINADVLVVSYMHSGIDTSIVVGSNYNQKNFNVYEFVVDFSLYNNQFINIEVLQSRTGFNDYNYLSESLEVKSTHDNCVELIWYNLKDTTIFYSTGIKNIGNYEFISLESDNDSGLEIHKTTNTSIVIEANNYELKKLIIDSLSTAIMNQVIQAALHKQFFVNRIKYISNNEPEVETERFTNFHQATLNLIKTGTQYTAEYGGGTHTSTP